MFKFPFLLAIAHANLLHFCSLGAIADLDLAVRSKNIKDDIMVVSTRGLKRTECCMVAKGNLDEVLTR